MTNSTRNLFTALASGVVLGSAIGVLLAPSEGSKTRRRLMGRQNKLEDDIDNAIRAGKKSLRNMQAELTDATEDAEYYFGHLVSEGRRALKEAKNKAENAENEADSYLTKVVRSGKRILNDMSHKVEDKIQDTVAATKAKVLKNDLQETN